MFYRLLSSQLIHNSLFLFAFTLITTGANIASADEWPQWRGPNRDAVWNETGIVKKFDAPKIALRWSTEVGSGYSGPTVAGGRVFLTDRVTEPEEIERIAAFDWKTGKRLWRVSYPCRYLQVGYKAGPRAAVTIDGDRAYALGTMGHLHCLDTASGKVLWKHDLAKKFKIRMPIWGIAAAPLVEKGLLILQIGGEKACLVALDKITGEERWKALDDKTSYSAPIMISQAGKRVLVCWTGANVVGLDPLSGKTHWRHPLKPKNMVIAITTPVLHNNRLFVSSFYDGSLMLRLSTDSLSVEKLWRRRGRDERNTESLHSIISTPYLAGDYVYGVDSYGELRCLSAKTGDRIWENKTAVANVRWGNIHMVRNADRMFMFNQQGELVIGKLSPEKFVEISRAQLIEPTKLQLNRRDGVCWAHPAYAYKHVFVRNDKRLVCATLAEE